MSLIDPSLARQYDRLPPMDIEAEMCVLGSMLLWGENSHAICSKIRRVLRPEHFYQADHQIIFQAICDLLDKYGKLDAMILRSNLVEKNLLEEVGGVTYIGQIITSPPSNAHGLEYAEAVKAKAVQRQSLQIANELARTLINNELYSGQPDCVDKAIEKFRALKREAAGIKVERIGEMAEDFLVMRTEGKTPSIPTGYSAFDETHLGILARGAYTIIGGRPSMGKSTLVRSMLKRIAARFKIPCGLISIEESGMKISGNYLSDESGIENHQVYTGNLGEVEWNELGPACQRLNEVPLHVCTNATSTAKVLDTIDVMVGEYGCQVLAVDHIHLMRLPNFRENRVAELDLISQMLKDAWKQHNCAGIVCCQLSRPGEKIRYPGAPTMTDIRACGNLEEHADSILLLHREDYYHVGEPIADYTPSRRAQVIIPKHRNGLTGMVVLRDELKYQRFVDLDENRKTPKEAAEEAATIFSDEPT